MLDKMIAGKLIVARRRRGVRQKGGTDNISGKRDRRKRIVFTHSFSTSLAAPKAGLIADGLTRYAQVFRAFAHAAVNNCRKESAEDENCLQGLKTCNRGAKNMLFYSWLKFSLSDCRLYANFLQVDYIFSCFYIFWFPFRLFLFFCWSAVSELELWSVATFRGDS